MAQINPTVGDIQANMAIALKSVSTAASKGAQIVALPEMIINGYPLEDLAFNHGFQQASEQAVQDFASRLKADGLGDVIVVAGYLRSGPHNSAAVIFDGKVVGSYDKHHLPNYGVFDEYRVFVSGNSPLIVRACGTDIGIAICEDLWQDGGPVAELSSADIGLLLVLNGSPYEADKDDVRLELVKKRAGEAQATLAYVNMCGGQDELVFEGDSIIVDKDGDVIARAPQFEDALIVVDLDLPDSSHNERLPNGDPYVVINNPRGYPLTAISAPTVRKDSNPLAEMYHALVVGLRDYVTKNKFQSVILGLSGGIDSALVAAICVDALGPDRVFGVSMPSKYSSEHSQSDAQDSAKRLGINIRTLPIEPMVDSFVTQLGLTGLAEENVQARVRGMSLMAISNQEGHLVLATGNKSELSVGYSTIYGDAVGGYAPIKDVLKTDVWALANWRNAEAVKYAQIEPIPQSSITKPPSAELRPGQQDSDSLPDYEVLDAIIRLYVEKDMSANEIIALGHDSTTVQRVISLTDRAEFKRQQYPIGTKVSKKAFGRDRRMPISSRWSQSMQ